MSEAGTNADAVAAEKERKFRIQGGFLSSPVRHLHIPLTWLEYTSSSTLQPAPSWA